MNKLLIHSLAAGMAFSLLQEPAFAAPANVEGRWGQLFEWPLIPVHLVMLPNGKIFSFGIKERGPAPSAWNYSVWDPTQGPFGNAHQLLSYNANNNTDIFCSSAAVIPGTGEVLMAGGDTREPANLGVNATQTLSADAQSISRNFANDMAFARWYPTQTTLPTGESLVYGGRAGQSEPISVPEKMVNGKWVPLWGANDADLMSMDGARWYYPRNWVAPNGKVFGITDNRMYFIDWNGEGAIQNLGQIPDKTRMHTSTAVMYLPGKILQVGGSTNGDTQDWGSNQAITVDVTSGLPVVENAPNMAFARIWGNSTILANGEVFISGGSAQENKLVNEAKIAEMWNPNTRQFRQLAAASTARLYHSSSILLMDASVLTGGGGAPGPLSNQNAEVFYPPYLYDGAGNFAQRPIIEEISSTALSYSSNANVTVANAQDIARVTLVRTGAATHSFDQSQRFLELEFNFVATGLGVNLPNSANLAPPGYYMLFIINKAGVPSLAKMITLGIGNAAPTAPPTVPVVPPIAVNDIAATAPQNNGIYTLVSRNSNLCAAADITGPQGKGNGTNILQWLCNGAGNQKFRVKALGDGSYNLVSIASERCLEVSELYNNNGRNIDQWDCYGAPNQAVRFVPSTNGSYQIRFNHSGKCMDVAGISMEVDANIHQWECTGTANQDWFFKP